MLHDFFLCEEVAVFFLLKVILCVDRWRDFCVFVCGSWMIFLWRGCVIFWWRGCMLFLWRGWMIFLVERLCVKKKRLCDFVHWEVAWVLCVERLRASSHSLTHSVWMIYFLSGGCVTFFCKEVVWFFIWEIAQFFVWRGCLIFFVKRLYDFCVKRWVKKSFLVKTVFLVKKVFFCEKVFFLKIFGKTTIWGNKDCTKIKILYQN